MPTRRVTNREDPPPITLEDAEKQTEELLSSEPVGSETKKETKKDSAPSRTRKPRTSTAKVPPLRDRLETQIGSIGLFVSVFNQADGMAVISGASNLAAALEHLAQENPTVRRILDASLTGSALLEVISAIGAIAVPIARNHGLFDRVPVPSLSGVSGADTLSADGTGAGSADTGSAPSFSGVDNYGAVSLAQNAAVGS